MKVRSSVLSAPPSAVPAQPPSMRTAATSRHKRVGLLDNIRGSSFSSTVAHGHLIKAHIPKEVVTVQLIIADDAPVGYGKIAEMQDLLEEVCAGQRSMVQLVARSGDSGEPT